MKRSRKIGLVVLGIGLVSAGVFILTPSEPVYEGRTLTEWLDEINGGLGDLDTNSPSARAFRHMGVDAIPHLLKHLRPDDSRIKKAANELLAKAPLVDWQFPTAPIERLSHASTAFHFLGPVAEPAIPELSAMLQDTNRTHRVSYHAAKALAGIGPMGADILIEHVKNDDETIRGDALLNLGVTQTPGNRHIAVILDHVSDPQIGWKAISALGWARQDPERTIPVLIDAFKDKDNRHRMTAALSLDRYGAEAKPWIPELLRLLSSTNQAVQAVARIAIAEIDPGALAEFDDISN